MDFGSGDKEEEFDIRGILDKFWKRRRSIKRDLNDFVFFCMYS